MPAPRAQKKPVRGNRQKSANSKARPVKRASAKNAIASKLKKNKSVKPHRGARGKPSRTTGITEATASSVRRPTETIPTPPPASPPRLLGEGKSTAAALHMLEKAIKLIYQKDFRRARQELKALLESHAGETEIAARTRTYIQICDREGAAQKRPSVSHDQFYNLGVLEHNRGNFDAAMAYFERTLEKHRDADHVYYSLAASAAMSGRQDAALSYLRRSIELNDQNRVYAKNDTDFSMLHDNRDFAELVGLSGSN
jgi:tetratricopeptide (TPR) repeat protein